MLHDPFLDGLLPLWVAIMGLAAVGVLASAQQLCIDGWIAWRRWLERGIEHQHAVVEDELRDHLVELDRKLHYRHNIHCPKCGRFARAGESEGASICKVHGHQLRVGDVVVEFGFRNLNRLPRSSPARLALNMNPPSPIM